MRDGPPGMAKEATGYTTAAPWPSLRFHFSLFFFFFFFKKKSSQISSSGYANKKLLKKKKKMETKRNLSTLKGWPSLPFPPLSCC